MQNKQTGDRPSCHSNQHHHHHHPLITLQWKEGGALLPDPKPACPHITQIMFSLLFNSQQQGAASYLGLDSFLEHETPKKKTLNKRSLQRLYILIYRGYIEMSGRLFMRFITSHIMSGTLSPWVIHHPYLPWNQNRAKPPRPVTVNASLPLNTTQAAT